MTNTLNIHALALKAASTLNIASGVITVTQQYHVLAAESGTTDDVDTISMGFTNLTVKSNTYYPLLCLTADSGDVITLKDGTGNLSLPNGDDIAIDPGSFVWLLWNGAAWTAPIAAATAGTLNDAVILAPDSGTRNDITAGADDETPLRLKPNSGTQSAPLLEIVNESDTPTASISKDGEIAFDMLKVNTATTLTIASGAVTITGGHHIIAAESGTADTLTTINGGVTGQFLLIQADSGDAIGVEQSTGNIKLADRDTSSSPDAVLENSGNMLLYFDGSTWYQISFNGVRNINFNQTSTTGQLSRTAGGTGANNTTNSEGDTLLSNGANGDYVTSPLPPGTRNLLFDPRMDYWPKTTTFTMSASLRYLPVWVAGTRVADGGSGTITFSQGAFTLGQTDVPGEPVFYGVLENNISGGGGDEGSWLMLPIEGVRTLAGGQITFSLWLRAVSGGTVGVTVKQKFDSADSEPAIYATGQTQAITTSWVRYHFTFTLPSVSGKVIGAQDRLEIILAKQLGATRASTFGFGGGFSLGSNLHFAQYQAEAGGIMTAFEARTPALERSMWERYHYILGEPVGSGSPDVPFAMALNATTTQARGVITFPQNMVRAPDLTTVGSFEIQHANTVTAITGISLDQRSFRTTRILADVASGLTAGQASMIRADSDASASLEFDARYY